MDVPTFFQVASTATTSATGPATSWLVTLFTNPTPAQEVAHAVLIFALVIASGMALGAVRALGLSLGIAGVLFSGIAFAHFGFHVKEEIVEFVREFGLILFVYTIGLQVGPGFLSSLRKAGLPLNLMAASVVLTGVATTIGLIYITQAAGKPIPVPAAVGLLSGGTTNTPSLAAAQQAVNEIVAAKTSIDANTNAVTFAKLPAQAYAIAYPFGVLGIILTMLLIRAVFRVDLARENDLFAHQNVKGSSLETVNLEVTNPNVQDRKIEDIPQLNDSGVVVSRILHGGAALVATPDYKLKLGDILHAVGTKDRLETLKITIGNESTLDVKTVTSNISTRRLVVTQGKIIGKTIEELDPEKYGVTITRTQRAETEIAAIPGWRFQFGDVVLAVGEPEGIKRLAHEIGDSVKKLDHPHIIPVFIGIALGVILGSIPFNIPGIPAPVRLGLAGGPLVVAIILSRIGQIGRLSWYMPRSANFALRELGIVLFLACVGLKAGGDFIATLQKGDGFYWMACAAVITAFPLLLVGFIGRLFLKINYVALCGLLAGSMTDPPALQFANQMTAGEAPSVAYATVYPLTMLLRVVTAQLLVLFLWHP
jgi:putative transport protein